MDLPKMDLVDLSESQWNRIHYEKCKPVVDIDGNAIGVAKNKHGAAHVTVQMNTVVSGPGSCTIAELLPAVNEYEDRFVIG